MKGDDLSGASSYRALVLGPFEVERDANPLDASGWQQRVQTLFKLLVTSTNRQRRRDDLIDLLWPEADPESASGNLRILVHRLRLTLGGDPSPVLSRNGWVALNPAYRWTLDLEEMEALVAGARGDPGRLESAVAMVRGEPLVENRYDDWAAPLVDRATRVWREACLQLAEANLLRGRQDEAIAWYQRVLDVDPLDEEMVRGLMTAHAALGNPSEAVRHYELFRSRLAKELDVEPAPDTEVLADSIRSQSDLPQSVAAAGPAGFLSRDPEFPLIGRDDELERALLCADGVRTGSGRLILVSGESGIGKTRLAHELGVRLARSGFLVTSARCYSHEQAVPFAVFSDLLQQVRAGMSPATRDEAAAQWPLVQLLLPGVVDDGLEARGGDTEDRYTLFRHCTAFLARAAQERPIASVLDDFQWVDDASLDLLRYLVRELRGRPVLLLATYRDGDISRDHPVSSTVRDLAREGAVERVFLGRLGLEETGQMLISLLDNQPVPSEFVEFVHLRTRGNPLHIRKLAHSLGGRYRLVRQIGAGGMGRVFEAVDERTQDRAAVKMMFTRTEADPTALLRFQQEGALLAGMHHPNIVEVRAQFVEEQVSCIAMELLEGRSLAELLRESPLPLDRVRNIALQILSALQAAHERGIVHRDVKPANVMVTDSDHVKVMDFGIARLARTGTDTSLTSTGMTVGTPLYMAPEQFHGDKVDARADLYAVGSLLYEMVTGKPPFNAEDPLALAFMHVNDAPAPLRAARPGLPAEWEAVILRALAKYPADRFQSAVAMGKSVAALPVIEGKAVRDSEPNRADPPSAVAPSAVPRRPRRRARVAGGALLALAGLAAALVAPHLFHSGPSRLTAFHGPDAVAVDQRGRVYVSDQGNDRVVVLSTAGKPIGSWGTSGQGTLQFDSPGSLVVAPGGTVDVVDAVNRRIQVLLDGRQTDMTQLDAGSLALDTRGHLFGSDFVNHHIWEFGSNWQILRTLDVPFVHVGPHPFPAGMTTDARGDLYLTDREHNRIVKLSPSGKVLLTAGTYGTAVSRQDRPLFNLPSAIAVTPRGRMYVADVRNYRIDVLSPAGRSMGDIPLTGKPVSIALDRRGNLYVAEYFANLVLKLSSNGTVLWTARGA